MVVGWIESPKTSGWNRFERSEREDAFIVYLHPDV